MGGCAIRQSIKHPGLFWRFQFLKEQDIYISVWFIFERLMTVSSLLKKWHFVLLCNASGCTTNEFSYYKLVFPFVSNKFVPPDSVRSIVN